MNPELRIIYSIDARLGGHGIGTIAFHAAAAIFRRGWLTRCYISSNAQDTIPARLIRQWGMIGRATKYLAVKDVTGAVDLVERELFDIWLAKQLFGFDIFHGWNGMCLRALREAKRRGAVTVVERASSHPRTYFALIDEEYRRWHVPQRLPRKQLEMLGTDLEEADYITIPSPFVRVSMLEAGIPAHKLLEVPFGADVYRFKPATTETRHAFRAVFAGQVSIRKGVPDLLDAWRMAHLAGAELWIVGGISHDLHTILGRWGALKRVQFIPHTSHLPEIFQQADVFVFPSIEEGSALVTYEAMAAGLPLLTTPNAGSVALDGVHGFIVPIRRPDLIAEKLCWLYEHPLERATIGHAARVAAESMTWERYGERLLTHYERIAHGR